MHIKAQRSKTHTRSKDESASTRSHKNNSKPTLEYLSNH
jgi:hypothetical protein